ncbi:Pkinase_Tyr domain-containing protein [Cephalotus follicularis]|uniref:Pkinase_Tyr domain-containing protein n=1 Tax=Cephalotus follicularis TaxID=3775 RepID=A0A1Q3DGG5_CEPFO|nr:Pkinase_Tyr domain-containing protein [Cephalotus follicularis]
MVPILVVLEVCVTISVLSVQGYAVTVASPPRRMPQRLSPVHPIKPDQQPPLLPADHAISPIPIPLSPGKKRHGKLVATPPNKTLSPLDDSSIKVLHQHHAHNTLRPSSIAFAPSMPSFRGPAKKWVHDPASLPSTMFHKYHGHERGRYSSSAPEPSYRISIPSYTQRGLSVSPYQSPFTSPISWGLSITVPSSSPKVPSKHFNMPILSPSISPLGSSLKKMKTPPSSPLTTLPPPPCSEDCKSVTCTEPLTYTPPGSACDCVWPIQVKICLGVAIYTFFPLVSELAREIAASVALNYSQVRIMGADAASQQLEKSTVLIDLVPQGVEFNYVTAYMIYKKIWQKQLFIKTSLFGAYEVIYVRYPGLPPSPPSAPFGNSNIDDGPYPGQENNGQAIKPLGVAVPKRKGDGISGSMIAIIVLSSFTAFILCFGITWLLLLNCGACDHQNEQPPHAFISSPLKPSEGDRSMADRSMSGSASRSISSSALAYTGSAKNFTLTDIERATDSFEASRKIGEGGFGIVYKGTLDDGREVAVKVLKRDDIHGSREFLAEVEMLSRLHHRNLVKLIGICTEERARCLVYELVPNGSVESHLHGVDKATGPLDWGARMKIGLDAARGLAYLHEDSNPRVIHRDFKSSNILLEHDFTTKVSDFGLARAAIDEGHRHISTHVTGTFGYLAPEYAMTGHLLVKSDVYSYGVVLLEILTGRKPVDLSQPPGQENIVTWARPLLTSSEGLDSIIDPAIKSDMSFDSIAKVAAIASMCVQPEVSHRPFMGEVVQALKLVSNEFDEMKVVDSRGQSQEDFSASGAVELVELSETSHPVTGYDFRHDRD